MELNGLAKAEVAEELGVTRQRIGHWLEPVKDAWEGTSFHAEVGKNEEDRNSFQTKSKSENEKGANTQESVNKPPVAVQQEVRRITGGGEKGETLLEQAQKEGLGERDMREVKKLTERGKSVDAAMDDVIRSKKETREGDIKVNTRVTFTGDYAQAIEHAAKDRGASDEQIVRAAVETWLEREGYI